MNAIKIDLDMSLIVATYTYLAVSEVKLVKPF